MSYGNGRIGEIIKHLEATYGQAVKSLSSTIKLKALCENLQMSEQTFDRMISENSPVLRTVKGHVFESFFDYLLTENDIAVTEVGGDDAVDRIVNNHTLQLKTYTEAGTKGSLVQYKTHKTHGAKSEKESMDYYHSADHFADFLIGLISYDPLNLIVLSKDELPRHSKSPSHILSPFTINWEQHKGLNALNRIGVELKKTGFQTPKDKNELLPLTAKKIGIGSNIILNTILNTANFRIWDMSIRGFSREIVFKQLAKLHKIKIYEPSDLRSTRSDKADHALKLANKNIFIQMKGISTNNCDFTLADPLLATETQLTRGRVNDHPTQSRLYLTTDFDFLVLGLDPPIVDICKKVSNQGEGLEWEFYLIPTTELEAHHSMPHRLKSIQKFYYSQIQTYKIINWKNQLT